MMIKREEKKMEDNFINFRSKEIYVCMIIIYTESSYTITVICIQSEDSPCPSHFFSSVCSSHTLSLNFPLLSPFTRCLFSSFFSPSHMFFLFFFFCRGPPPFPPLQPTPFLKSWQTFLVRNIMKIWFWTQNSYSKSNTNEALISLREGKISKKSTYCCDKLDAF